MSLLTGGGELTVRTPGQGSRFGDGQPVDRSQLRGISLSDEAREIVARARSSGGLGNEEAMTIAVGETRLHRARRDD